MGAVSSVVNSVSNVVGDVFDTASNAVQDVASFTGDEIIDLGNILDNINVFNGGWGPLSGVMNVVEDIGSGIGDLAEGAGGLVTDTLEGVGNTVGAFLDNPVDFTKNVVKNALDNPVKTGAIIAASYFAPELLAELAPELAGAEGALTAEELASASEAANQALAQSGITESAINDYLSSLPSGYGTTDATINDIWSNIQSLGDQAGDFPTPDVSSGAYGSATASGVQDAVQNLLDNNALNQMTGVTSATLGDQAGDYPTPDVSTGAYGDPLATGVSDATKALLDYNAAYATPSLLDSLSNLSKSLGQGLSGNNSNTAYLLAKGLIGGNQDAQIGYNMNKNPFVYPTQQPLQGGMTTSALPPELQQQNQTNALASLLRK